ncbi:acyl carrier protein [archaeon]|jgi:acyl carrier protein|nr:acyl carrier protein [archaeon]
MKKELGFEDIKIFLGKIILNIPEDITENLFEQNILDSISLISFIVSIEDEYSINISPSDLTSANFSTIENIYNTIKNSIQKEVTK